MRDNIHRRTCHSSFSYSSFDDEEELEDEEHVKAPAEEECSHKSEGEIESKNRMVHSTNHSLVVLFSLSKVEL